VMSDTTRPMAATEPAPSMSWRGARWVVIIADPFHGGHQRRSTVIRPATAPRRAAPDREVLP